MAEIQTPPMDPASMNAKLLMQPFPGFTIPFEYEGNEPESTIYRTSAWIGTTLASSPVVDIVGPDAVKFLHSICVNDFSKLGMTGLRHAIICNDKGQILTDGVVIRIGLCVLLGDVMGMGVQESKPASAKMPQRSSMWPQE